MLFVLNFYFIIIVNSFIISIFLLGKGFIIILFLYFSTIWFLFLFYKCYNIFILTHIAVIIYTLALNKFYIISLSFLSLFIYFTFIFLFLIKFYNKVSKGYINFKFIIFTMFFNLLLILFYFFIFLLFTLFFKIYIIDLFNLEDSQTFFYFFKYEFKWLMIYAWGIPIFFILVCQCMFLLFLLSSNGYDFSKNFEYNVSNWYCTIGFKELHCFHDFIYYPFKVMGSAFKFEGNYLDISENERTLVYISSLVLILILVLFWIESMFLSMPINWIFLGFCKTECTHFGPLFKFLSKYFVILSVLIVIFLNLFLVISSFFIIAFIFCFAGNLFVNYEVLSGRYYEPIYFTAIDGNNYCIVTPSQFRVHHNVWFYNGIYWILEETNHCRTMSGKSSYGYLVKL